MNDLKFRAYIKEYNETCDVLNIDFVNRCFYVLPYDELEGGNQIEIKNMSLLEQFTGLTDKNGKEIYEGDMFLRNDHTGVVRQKDSGEWIIAFTDNKIIKLFYDEEYNFKRSEYEIIGNIHQNPELLNNN